MKNESDEIKYKLMDARIMFEAPESLSVEDARDALEYWLVRFDRHGVLDMDYVALDVKSTKARDVVASENELLDALLDRGWNASKVDLPSSAYDLVLEKSAHDMIRIQVKTVSKEGKGSVSFTGGTRGGSDREYKSGVKEYVQSTKTSDVVIGVSAQRDNGDCRIDFYIIPTLFIEKLNPKSLATNRIPMTKNNWKLLLNCKDEEFVNSVFSNF